MSLDKDAIIQALNMPFETLDEIISRADYNDLLAGYYRQYADDTGDPRWLTVADRVEHCFGSIFTDRYNRQKVYNITSVNYCRNRFCANCIKLIQATRLKNLSGILDDTMVDYDLYHVVLTLPNVTAKDLADTVDILFEAFAVLVEYMKGKRTITGMDFSFLGYYAALRALEVTYNKETGEYHPHIHSVFAFRKGLVFNKIQTNVYSYDTKNGKRIHKRYFCDFELLLQKIWRQIVDNLYERNEKRRKAKNNENAFTQKIGHAVEYSDPVWSAFSAKTEIFRKPKRINARRITGEKIAAMGNNDGYSVIMDLVDSGNYYEVFKYAFKLFDENSFILGYEQFTTLLESLSGRRLIQCYGAWYNVEIGDDIDEQDCDALAQVLIEMLRSEEEPDKIGYLTVQELREKKKHGYAVITASKIVNMLREEYSEEERLRFIDDVRPLLERILRDMRLDRIDRDTQKQFSMANLNDKTPTGDEYARLKRMKIYNETVKDVCRHASVSMYDICDNISLKRKFIRGELSESELVSALFAQAHVVKHKECPPIDIDDIF